MTGTMPMLVPIRYNRCPVLRLGVEPSKAPLPMLDG